MFIDTHAHIYHDRLEADFDAVLTRAQETGVDRVLMPAIDLPSIRQALALCDRHKGLYAMAALHPTEVKEATDADFDRVAAFCDDSRVVAVGETGLDYYWDRSFDRRQQDYLRRHVCLATVKGLPLVLHLRDKKNCDEVHQDIVKILKEELPSWSGGAPRGVFHCFTGPEWLIAEAADLGFLLGIGGVITFKNAGVDKLLEQVPLTQLILETDSPYMAPAPHRGRRNEPAFLRFVVDRLVAITGCTLEEVADVTTRNAERLFRLPQHTSKGA